jgi:hypothetical protein
MAYGQGFAGNFLGALGQQQQMGAQQAQAGNAQWDQMYKLAALQGEVEEREYMRAQQAQQQAAAAEAAKREQAQKLQLAKDQWDLRNQLPEHLRELFDIDQATAIERGFAEPDKGTTLQQNLAAGGLQPDTPEYQQALLRHLSKPAVEINQGPKLPTGFQWKDPDNPQAGVAPLQGGPADPSMPTTEQRNKLATAQKTYKQLTDQITNYAQSVSQGVATLPGPERDKVKTQREQIKLQLKNLYELGAITGPDEGILDNLIFDPTSTTSRMAGLVPGIDSPEQRALANLEVLKQEADRALAAAGGASVKQEPAPGAGVKDMSTEELLAIINGGGG